MNNVELKISGMTCDSCARHVEAALGEAGVEHVTVDWRRGRALVEEGHVDEDRLAQALSGSRYQVESVRRPGPAPGVNGGRSPHDYDLIVLGSGGGAFAAAIRARDWSRRVLMVEQGTVGGTCVNVGCIPSKTLLVDSERARHVGQPSLADALARKTALVSDLRHAKYEQLIDRYGIDFRHGRGRIVDPHTVEVDGDPVSAGAILIATGARPAVPAIPGLAEAGYLTSTSALELAEAPGRLAVLGANAVGLELGQMLGNFGSQVTFIARRDVAPNSEPEVSSQLRAVLEADGHRVIAPAISSEVVREGAEKVLRGTVDGEPFEVRADEILVATGRTPNTDSLGLAEVGVAVDERGAVVVDEHQRTSAPSIYAAGDVTTQPRFVYVAAAAGAAAASNALGVGEEVLDFSALPQIIFTTPPIAEAGLTEQAAIVRGFDVETRVLPLDAIPRALVNGDTSGLFKLVAERGSGRLVGVSILAEGAPDVIQAAVLAIDKGLTVGDLSSTWAPYLAMAEGLKLAAQTFTRDVAQLSCCAA